MRATTKRFAAITGGLVMAAGTLTIGTATTASAASCYGGAVSKTFDMGTDEAAHYFGPYYASSQCNDINLKLTSWGNGDPFVKVCFYPSSGGSYCQSSDRRFEKSKDLNKWRVIATNVKPGTKYKIKMDFASRTFKGKIAD